MVTEPSSPMRAQLPGLDRCERGAGLPINESAPAIARATARIDAAPEIAFRILSIVWRGRAFGTRTIHVWRLAPDGSGTQVDTEESFEGWLVSLLRPMSSGAVEVGR
jgi:hypothetical protein